MEQKTILIPIYNGIRAKNFFRNDSYRELVKDPRVKLVVIIPPSKLEYYRKEFPEKNVTFEPLDIISESRFGVILSVIGLNLLDTDTMRAKQQLEYLKYKNRKKFLLKRFANRVASLLPSVVRGIIRVLDRFVILDVGVVKLLDKYRPNLVVVPDIVFPPDRVLLRAAKRKKYPVVGMIRSWDNLTSKGIIQLLPDKLIAHTTMMKNEAIKYAGMPKKDIIVTGIPHYDIFYEPRNTTREEFLKTLGIPQDRKVVLCAPFVYNHTGSAEMIIRALVSAIDDGRLPQNTHLLIRYRPATPEIENEKLPKSDHITVTKPCEHLFSVNNLQSPTMDWEFSKDDLELLMNSLYFSDVAINYMSTLSIDAAVFDKPVINVRFEPDKSTPPWQHIDIFSKYLHYKSIEDSGGVKMVWNMNELIDATRAYLENSALDRDGRRKMIQEQIEFTDAKSGKRTAEAIKNTLFA